MTSSAVFFKQMEIGPMGNYIYFVGDKNAKQVAVVDPAWDSEWILAEAAKDGVTICAILLTHGHEDHVNAVADLLEKIDVPVYLSEHEALFLTPECKNLTRTADHQRIAVGKIEIECLHTPGHTPGCQCYKVGHILITGDTLFIDGCGRTDLPGGDPQVMFHTLAHVIRKLPDDLVLYSGHGYGPNAHDTLGNQKKTNPFLQFTDPDSFTDYM